MRDIHSGVAVSVALLSAFMALTRVKDDNVVQAMQRAKADAVDSWAEYQGKRIRHQVLLLGKDQAKALLALAWAFGLAGLALGLAGLFGWSLHPGALTRPLS